MHHSTIASYMQYLRTWRLLRHASYRRFSQPKPQSLNKPLLYTLGGATCFVVYNLNEAPFTQRLRLLWVPAWMERKIGDYLYRQILGQFHGQIVPENDRIYAQVGKVMDRLLHTAKAYSSEEQRARLEKLHWKIHIVRSNEPNAFILPNGKIFVFSSILPICQNESGLATVLAHELSHQLARHSLEQLSKQPLYVLLLTAIYATTGVLFFSDLLVAGLLQMPALREMESEADRIGCELVARLCFDLAEPIRFWRRMEQVERQMQQLQLAQFFSTHPHTQKRIDDIASWMPHLRELREASQCSHLNSFRSMW